MVSFGRAPVCFGEFELNPSTRELRRHGLRVRVKPQAMSLLCLLVEQPTRMRTREEIQRRLWQDTYVDFEHSLNKVVHSLREALGDSASNPRYIETVATQGYRFASEFVVPQTFNFGMGSRGDGTNYLAVLPIGVEGDEELRFLACTVASLLTDELSAVDGVRVIAESTVKSHRLECADPQSAGVSLGVGSVLTGELRRHNGSMYLHMELIDVNDGRLLHGARAEVVAQSGVSCELPLVREILRQISPVLRDVSSNNLRSQMVLVG
jgi:DNA-binding winged helix-turn-helix (wHTH) protein/TolB-like protein